jgi:Zn-dependent protease with chaperone function
MLAGVGGRGAGALGGLDNRRGWARLRALVACLIGVLIFALSAAAFVMIGFAAVARMWSWITGTSFLDAPVWSWAPGGAAALGATAVIVSFLGAFWYFWRGASPQVLKEVSALPLDLTTAPAVANVVEALSIGIGRSPPRLYVTDDPAPNALSLRSRRSRILVVTSGCSVLTRDELEALCAHELGHLWANDAHWVTSGMVALARARRFGSRILAIGIVLFVMVAGVAHYADIILWSAGLVAIALVALGWASKSSLRSLEFSVRRNADAIADVAAIRLAKNPASLGAVCVRLAGTPARVSPVGWRSELMWFEAVESVKSDDGEDGVVSANQRSHRELLDRAVDAYMTAHVPLPPEVQSSRNAPAR